MIVLHILLMILKIIGLILLGILALLVLILLVVMLVPLRYRVVGKTGEGSNIESLKATEVHVRVSWLLRIVNVHFNRTRDGTKLWIRILFYKKDISLGGKSEDEKGVDSRSAPKRREKAERRAIEKTVHIEKKVDLSKATTPEIPKADLPDTEPMVAERSEMKPPDTEPVVQEVEISPYQVEDPLFSFGNPFEEDAEETGGVWARVSDAVEKIKSICISLKNNLTSLKKKIAAIINRIRKGIDSVKKVLKNIQEQISKSRAMIRKVRGFLGDEVNKKAFGHIWREVKGFLLYLLPTKAKIHLRFSAGSPDTTGKILGFLCAQKFYYKKNVSMLADFEADSWFVQGDFDIRGRFRAGRPVGMGIRLILDKNIRHLIKDVRNFRR